MSEIRDVLDAEKDTRSNNELDFMNREGSTSSAQHRYVEVICKDNLGGTT